MLTYNQKISLLIIGLILLGVFAVAFAVADEIENCGNNICVYDN